MRGRAAGAAEAMRSIGGTLPGEDVFRFIARERGAHDAKRYAQILGAANAFKDGDRIVGVAAADEASRQNARTLLANTRLADIDAHPLHPDTLFAFISAARDAHASDRLAERTLGQLKQLLLGADEAETRQIMPGLSSDVVACVVKLSSNDELIAIGKKIFNPLPGSRIGARGYLGARIQPNSPTDNVDDIRWQVFDLGSAEGSVVHTCRISSSDRTRSRGAASFGFLMPSIGL